MLVLKLAILYTHVYCMYVIPLQWECGALQSRQADLITGNRVFLGGWSFCSRLTKYRVHVFETSLSFECKILIFNGSPKCSGKKNSVTKLRCIPLRSLIPLCHQPQQGSSSRWHAKPLPLQSSDSPDV